MFQSVFDNLLISLLLGVMAGMPTSSRLADSKLALALLVVLAFGRSAMPQHRRHKRKRTLPEQLGEEQLWFVRGVHLLIWGI